MRARVIIILFDGIQGLDVFGPAEVFAAANRLLPAPRYEMIFASTAGGPRGLSSGAMVDTRPLASVRARAGDTIVVPGGDDAPVDRAAVDPALLRWLRRNARAAG